MNIFYTPDLTGKSYTLSEEESKHCVRVLRLQLGDVIHLVDGKGGYYQAKISNADPKRCDVVITNEKKEWGKRNFYLHLAVAPTKNNDRFEWLLEKTTEIGVDEISPLLCEHSERDIVKTDRMNKVLVSAMKQSLKAYLPTMNEITAFEHFLNKDFIGQKFIAHCAQGEKEHIKRTYHPGTNCLILIGPEGDFSSKEISMAQAKGFIPIHLGPSRLRTETAAIAACHAVNLLSD